MGEKGSQVIDCIAGHHIRVPFIRRVRTSLQNNTSH